MAWGSSSGPQTLGPSRDGMGLELGTQGLRPTRPFLRPVHMSLTPRNHAPQYRQGCFSAKGMLRVAFPLRLTWGSQGMQRGMPQGMQKGIPQSMQKGMP